MDNTTNKRIQDVVPGSVWRHFKGNHVATVITLAKSTVDETMQVVYTCFCTDGDLACNDIWVRPLDEFLSRTPHDKYPQYTQKYRFERIK